MIPGLNKNEEAKVSHYGRKEVTKTVISPTPVYHLPRNFVGKLRISLRRNTDKDLTLRLSL